MSIYLPTSGSLSIGGGTANSFTYVFGPGNSLTAFNSDLNSFVGKTWFLSTSASSTFAKPLDMGSFYGKSPIAPVTAAGARYYISSSPPGVTLPTGYSSSTTPTSGSIVIPQYTTLTIDIYGSGAGGGGGAGNGGPGGPGGAGGATIFGTSGQTWYLSSPGGTGGTGGPGTPGTSGTGSVGYPPGGGGGGPNYSTGGGSPGGTGGAGGHSQVVVVNPAYAALGLSGTVGPNVGQTVAFTIGAIGGGGGGSSSGGLLWNGPGGNPGSYGWVDIGWA